MAACRIVDITEPARSGRLCSNVLEDAVIEGKRKDNSQLLLALAADGFYSCALVFGCIFLSPAIAYLVWVS